MMLTPKVTQISATTAHPIKRKLGEPSPPLAATTRSVLTPGGTTNDCSATAAEQVTSVV